ncbi:DUF881 domain-containing protein [Clostridium sp. MSJ-11]|uniref:DUF881 domain-containing protein n=1 Tax=Clostridium mobile TaxID=2841512 RepID=A0ABS6EET0_9CLOT|nr:DUF881 domain-containing protein [Clostridium mobile]MBU5482980.1 DUF881 domain-containing protein [Clostridium mobile]
MRNSEASVFIFIASIIIGVLISMNISLTRESSIVFLSSKEYQDAYSYRNQLVNNVSNLNKEYLKYLDKLYSYEKNIADRDKIIEEINNELTENKELIGYSELEGPGIKITLMDATTEFVNDPFEYESRLIHDRDMINVVNDLASAGAEAISINGIRLIPSSGIFCNGAFLRINGIQISAPFYINVIGNKEALKSYMLAEENYLRILMFREIQVEVTEEENVRVPAFQGKLEYKYSKPIKE